MGIINLNNQIKPVLMHGIGLLRQKNPKVDTFIKGLFSINQSQAIMHINHRITQVRAAGGRAVSQLNLASKETGENRKKLVDNLRESMKVKTKKLVDEIQNPTITGRKITQLTKEIHECRTINRSIDTIQKQYTISQLDECKKNAENKIMHLEKQIKNRGKTEKVSPSYKRNLSDLKAIKTLKNNVKRIDFTVHELNKIYNEKTLETKL